jgi:hypothetical protein
LSRFDPDVYGEEALVFPSASGTPLDYQNFRARIFNPIVRKAFGRHRRVTPHMLRHTFASLHLARGTNLKWLQEIGGWSSAKMLLDVYGHFMPSESAGFADALTTANGPTPAPRKSAAPEEPRNPSNYNEKYGADEPIRTVDLLITSELLYQLSYVGMRTGRGREF